MSLFLLLFAATSMSLRTVGPAGAGSLGPAEGAYAGWIDQISGSAYLSTSSGKSRRLDPSSDRHLKLYAGQTLTCEKGCSISLVFKDGRREELHDSPLPFHIREVTTDLDDPKAIALRSYEALGGSERGAPSLDISWPVEGAVVRPQDLILRWKRRTGTISLILEDASHKPFWRQDNVDGTLGYLQSDRARDMLIKYRESAEQGSFYLKMVSQGVVATVRFGISLSRKEEQELNRELQRWDHEAQGFMRTVCRAYSFISRGMFVEGAQEYDSAVASEPAGRDLVLVAIEMQERIGNFERADQLRKQLPPAADSPE